MNKDLLTKIAYTKKKAITEKDRQDMHTALIVIGTLERKAEAFDRLVAAMRPFVS